MGSFVHLIPAKLALRIRKSSDSMFLISGQSCDPAHRLQTQPGSARLLQWASSGLGLPASVLDLHQPRPGRARVHGALARPLQHGLQDPGPDNIRPRGLRGHRPRVRPRPAPRPRQPPAQSGIPTRPPPSQGWPQTVWK